MSSRRSDSRSATELANITPWVTTPGLSLKVHPWKLRPRRQDRCDYRRLESVQDGPARLQKTRIVPRKSHGVSQQNPTMNASSPYNTVASCQDDTGASK